MSDLLLAPARANYGVYRQPADRQVMIGTDKGGSVVGTDGIGRPELERLAGMAESLDVDIDPTVAEYFANRPEDPDQGPERPGQHEGVVLW